MTTAIYARVSTKGQDTDNQIDQLREVASKAGWEISEVFVDHGISGAKGRNQRPGLDTLLKAVTRRDVLIAAIDLDRSLDQHQWDGDVFEVAVWHQWAEVRA